MNVRNAARNGLLLWHVVDTAHKVSETQEFTPYADLDKTETQLFP